MSILGRIFGWDKDRQDAAAKAEISRQSQQEPAQPHVQPFAPEAQPAPEPEPQPRPGTRMMPEQAERMQDAHGRKPKPEPEAEKEPERTETATKMAYQRTRQPGPSLGGSGVTFPNPLAHQPRQSVAEEMLAEARAKRAEAEAAKTPEQKLDDELQRLERPDYSRERQRWDDSRSR